ncbi:hypothetical protein BGX27_000998 [Mortierella sp. AM989]|nr:hypothetical protein BGX27_000998 [Mortierella sp. AM989]
MTKAPAREFESHVQVCNDQDGPDIWSWITSHRTTSDLQRQYELDEEKPRLDTYNRKPPPEQDAMKEDLSGIDDVDNSDSKGKNVKGSSIGLQMSQESDLTGRDAVALMMITIVAIGARFWRISWPDEIV